jgi:hypothetical protein
MYHLRFGLDVSLKIRNIKSMPRNKLSPAGLAHMLVLRTIAGIVAYMTQAITAADRSKNILEKKYSNNMLAVPNNTFKILPMKIDE